MCVVIFSSSWVVIDYQAHHLGFLWPNTIRFFIAGLLLTLFSYLTKTRYPLNKRQHQYIFKQSLFVYSLNFIAIYAAAQYLPSGLNALVCGTVVFFNILNNKLLLGKRYSFFVICGACLGLLGLAFALSGTIVLESKTLVSMLFGVSLGLVGAYLTSVGQVRFFYLKTYRISPLMMNAVGMLYGSSVTALIALVVEGLPSFNVLDLVETASLVYMAFVPTALGFVLFTILIQKTNAEKASYVFLLTPVVALFVSSIIGESQWTIMTSLGLGVIACGYALVLNQDKVL